MNRLWSENEVSFLKANFKRMKYEEISKQINRSEIAITRKFQVINR